MSFPWVIVAYAVPILAIWLARQKYRRLTKPYYWANSQAVHTQDELIALWVVVATAYSWLFSFTVLLGWITIYGPIN